MTRVLAEAEKNLSTVAVKNKLNKSPFSNERKRGFVHTNIQTDKLLQSIKNEKSLIFEKIFKKAIDKR